MRLLQILTLAASLVALAGCATAPAPSGITYIGAPRMTQLIEASTPQMAATETGTLRTWVTIRNRSKTKLMVEGRASFTGDKGQPIEAPTGWQSVFIEGESSAGLQFLSMSAAARQVNIELREGNR